MDLTGRKLGKYEITDVVGRGGMAAVYSAKDLTLGRVVAVKVLSSSLAQSTAHAIERFKSEAQIIAQLKHPNIVPLFDFGQEGDISYFVTPLLRGEPLSACMKRGPFAGSEVRSILTPIAAALDYAHLHGIVHRDVKPSNIMLDLEGNPHLMDFGIALSPKPEHKFAETGIAVGTILYMAPEVIEGQPVEHNVDNYALGLVAFEMLAGRPAFKGNTAAALAQAILEGKSQSLAALRPELPRRTVEAIHKAFARNKADRYIFASEFIDTAFPAAEFGVSEDNVTRIFDRFISGSATQNQAPAPKSSSLSTMAAGSSSGSGAAPAPVEPDLSEFDKLFGAQPAPSQPVKTPKPPPPGPLPFDATQMFSTRPAPPRSDVNVHEMTGVFPVVSGNERNPAPPLSSAAVPDVCLSISRCADSVYIGRKVSISTFPFRIGRNTEDFRISFDRAISAEHVEIDYADGCFTIRDLGSANGTFVNGRRLHARRAEPLYFGSRVLLGSNTELVFGSNELTEIPDLTGKTIESRFTLVERLHSTGKSVIYAAEDRKLPRTVVLKFLAPRLLRHPGYREQFKREAEIACHLKHPNICRLIDYGETTLAPDTRSLYVCMDYLDGGSLSSRIASNEQFDVNCVCRWLEPLCDALDYMHGAGIIHAGLKPASIVFDSSGNPYVADFAVASSDSSREHGVLIGAPPFLAPEQWDGQDMSPAVDQYSLSVIFYLAITGALPFEGQEHPEVRRRNYMRGAVPAHEMAAQHGRSAVPPAVSQTLKRAMSVDPGARFESVGEFGRDFTRALAPAKVATKRTRVFISYHRRTSSPWALLLKKELERDHGFDIFVDSEQRDTAGSFPARIERNISEADVFVCILAEPTLQSAWVKHEIEVAHNAGKPMIPVFQETFSHPDLQAVDACITALLLSDGVKLLDVQNIYIDAALKELGNRIRHLEIP
jgi:serine/threonine protein kinase